MQHIIEFDSITWPPLKGIQDGDYKLQRTYEALTAIGNPQLKNIIHIAGTNGKGSTSAFLRAVLEDNGYTCNVYTSPHLVKINERIKIHGKDISDEKLKHYAKEVYSKLKEHNLHNSITFFEGMTVLMFYIFAQEPADFNIIEVGLGGRYDATNVITNPLISIITSISLDHQSYLGNTLPLIAREKCEIIKPNSIALMGIQSNPEVYDVFTRKCESVGTKYFICKEPLRFGNKLDETYQAQNATLVLKALELVSQKLGIKLKDNIPTIIAGTQWGGRMHEVFVKEIDKTVMVDCAHNIDGVSQFLKYIAKQSGSRVLIFGMLQRKIHEGITQMLHNALTAKTVDCIVTVNFHGEECMDANKLATAINHPQCFPFGDLPSAINKAGDFDGIFLCGSIYMVGDFFNYISTR